MIYIDVKRCSDRVDCKSDQEIEEYFGNMNLIMLRN